MSNYEFGGSLYGNRALVLNAIAGEWMHAGGANTDADILEAFATMTDAELAAECIDGWKLDQSEDNGWSGEEAAPSAMERDDWTAEDLAAAFARQREELSR
jgi:hypothetical protein